MYCNSLQFSIVIKHEICDDSYNIVYIKSTRDM